jgi:hypothetical protein
VFFVQGGRVQLYQNWTATEAVERDDRWTIADLDTEMKRILG